MGGGRLEDDADDVTAKVLEEIGVDIRARMGAAAKGPAIVAAATAHPATEAEMPLDDEERLMQRLAALR